MNTILTILFYLWGVCGAMGVQSNLWWKANWKQKTFLFIAWGPLMWCLLGVLAAVVFLNEVWEKVYKCLGK
jgi:hypothetical protein